MALVVPVQDSASYSVERLHVEHVVHPPTSGKYSPTEHCLQPRSAVNVHSTASKKPSSRSHGEQLEHSRSDFAVTAADSNVTPRLQVDACLHRSAAVPSSSWYVPIGHVLHTRLDDGVGTASSYVPTSHAPRMWTHTALEASVALALCHSTVILQTVTLAQTRSATTDGCATSYW